MSDILGGQWANVGPAEAKARHNAAQGIMSGHGPQARAARSRSQGKLFDPDSLGHIPAHHQSPQQFAADPRTWWHGRYANKLTAAGGAREGFHAGTLGAATIRLEHNTKQRGVPHNKKANLFPLRLTGQMGNDKRLLRGGGGLIDAGGGTPETASEDVNVHSGLGRLNHGYFYENSVEDPGHISVGVPQRKGFLSTHKEMVKDAQSRGEYVHPNIAWAAKKMPEHLGEEIPSVASRRASMAERMPEMYGEGKKPDRGLQRSLNEDQFKSTFSGDYDRRRVATEGGAAMSVWRKREGSALEPHVWQGQHDWH